MGFFSRAIEKRWHPAKWPRNGNFEKWLITGKMEDDTYTGKSIDEESALSNTAVWSAVMQISQTIASLPLHLYQRQDRGKKRAITHHQYQMLHLKPNPFMSTMSFREALTGQVLRYGTCYAEKELDESGRVIALWPLLSKKVRSDIFLNDIVYIIDIPGGKQKVLDRSRVFRVNGFSSNGLIGYNPIDNGKQSIALALAIEEYGARFFGNGARPAAVLEHPASLSQVAQDRLRKAWNDIHQGLENSHRIAILEEGMKLHEFTINAEDSQTLQTRTFQIAEVARIFNMPLHMLKELTRSTFNNIEVQSAEFVRYTLRPWLIRFEQEYTIQLLSDKEQKKYFYEHLIDGLMRGDTAARHQAYAVGRQWGYYSANDILEMENRNPIGKQGDIYLNPMNMVPADKVDVLIDGMINKKPESFNDEEEDFESLRKISYLGEKQIQRIRIIRDKINNAYVRIFQDAITTILNRECIAIKRSSKKEKDKFKSWLEVFYQDHGKYIREKLEPIVVSLTEQVSNQAYDEIFISEDERKIDLENIIFQMLESYVKKHIEDNAKFVEDICNRSDEENNTWIRERSEIISKEEVVRMNNIVCTYIFRSNHYSCFIHRDNKQIYFKIDPVDNLVLSSYDNVLSNSLVTI